MPLLQLENITRTFVAGDETVVALDKISVSIEAGEMLAIVGASGSGKSTLMNILGGLDQPSEGSYRFNDREVSALDPDELAELRREHFGFIFQRYHLMGDLTATGNVETPAVYAGLDRAARRERATALLTRLGLDNRLDHRPNQLSGGQQQRVSIARALMNGGDVILADEPTGALDSKSGEAVMGILRELHADGHTIIIVTHDLNVAEHTDRIIELKDGSVIADRRLHANATAARPIRASSSVGSLASLWRRLVEAFPMAFRAMGAHRVRTALTMLGIVIGIAAVVVVVGLGEGSQRKVLDQISDLGSSTISIYPGSDWGDERAESIITLVPADADALALQTYIDSVTPEVSSSGRIRFKNRSIKTATINGVGESYFRVSGRTMLLGVSFEAEDTNLRTQRVIIDEKTNRALFRQDDPLGQVIMVQNVPFMVIGVVASRAGDDGGAQVYIPYTSVQDRLIGAKNLQSLTVRVNDTVDTKTAEAAVVQFLTRRHGVKDFYVFNSDQLRKTIEKTSRTFSALISSVAAIALLVGGIGVMNIMLVSVTERTKEIGLRMAVGARRVDIMLQFLIEAVTVCIAGAVIGVGLALAIGVVIGGPGSDFPIIFSPASIAVACLTAMTIGLVFGFLPANNAARLDPVEALARD